MPRMNSRRDSRIVPRCPAQSVCHRRGVGLGAQVVPHGFQILVGELLEARHARVDQRAAMDDRTNASGESGIAEARRSGATPAWIADAVATARSACRRSARPALRLVGVGAKIGVGDGGGVRPIGCGRRYFAPPIERKVSTRRAWVR